MTIDTQVSNPTGIDQWTVVLRACFTRRLRPEQVEDALHECHNTYRISGGDLMKLLLDVTIDSQGSSDPLMPAFLAAFLQASFLTPADALQQVLERSRGVATTNNKDLSSPPVTSATQESILSLLSLAYTSSDRPKTKAESVATFRAVLSWMEALNASSPKSEDLTDESSSMLTDLIAFHENVGAFLLILLGNLQVKRHLDQAIPKNAKSGINAVLSSFSESLAQWSTSPIYMKLQLSMKLPPLALQTSRPWDLSASELSTEVVDLPVNRSRAGLYIYLNAALSDRPLVDDVRLNSYLQALYQNDDQSLICDLVVASFDALANVLQRHEPEHTILCHRAFIADKLQSFISPLTMNHIYEPSFVEQSIQMALGRIETHPFPPLSADSAGFNDILRDVRHDLVNAAFRHQLISETTATAVLGQESLKKLSRPLHNRLNLTQQILSQPQRSEDLMLELEKLTGEAAVISTSLVEALRQTAASKEITALRTICAAMYKNLPFLDILFQSCRLTDVLTPLCTVLNEWTHDDEQSELQPAYEDFAGIMLLTLAVIHRYDVQVSELRSSGDDDFVIRYLTRSCESRAKSALSDTEIVILDKWAKGLFSTDEKGESSGIRDDIMSGCSPQTFHLLVPTLFQQIVMACRAKILSPQTLKGGLEFLLEPFLLPSLIGGLGWLSNHVWTTRDDTEIAFQIMQRLIKPTSMSGDAHIMHQTILGLLYKNVRPCLQEIDKRLSRGKEVAQLIAVLRPHADSQHELLGTASEIRGWAEPFGTLRKAVSNLILQLSTWTTQSALNPIPPAYTHRMFETAVDRLGAGDVLDVLVDSTTSQTSIGLGPSALEVAASLICAPNIYNTQSGPSATLSKIIAPPDRLDVRSVLTFRCSDTRYLLAQEHTRAETLIRLHRLVEARVVLIEVPLAATIDIGASDLVASMGSAVPEVDAVATAAGIPLEPEDQAALDAATAEITTALDQNIDLAVPAVDMDMTGTGGLNIDLNDNLFNADGEVSFDLDMSMGVGDLTRTNQLPAQAQDLAVDDDIFAGLDLGMMGEDEFNF